jgi:sterol desaturase/sphingolipid hydroxylase (fatty acid hydroxylase superfamily)
LKLVLHTLVPETPTISSTLLFVVIIMTVTAGSNKIAMVISSPFPELYSENQKKKSNLPKEKESKIWTNIVLQWLLVGVVWPVYFRLSVRNNLIIFEYPTLSSLPFDLFRFVIAIHVYDFCIYWQHRLSHEHKGSFFWKIHQQHHLNNKPAAFNHCIYGSYLENFMITSYSWLPLIITPSTHTITSFAIYFVTIGTFVCVSHSGRDVVIPYLYDAKFHQRHHVFQKVNYSEHTHFYDWLFGTLGESPLPAKLQ